MFFKSWLEKYAVRKLFINDYLHEILMESILLM